MSRVWSRRSADDDFLDHPSHVEDDIPFYGPNPYDDPGLGGYDDLADDGEVGENIADVAREARAMARMMGEPLDAEFDRALQHIERGADPDDVFGEMDDMSEPPVSES